MTSYSLLADHIIYHALTHDSVNISDAQYDSLMQP